MPIEGPQYLADEGEQPQQQTAFPALNRQLDRHSATSPAAMMLKERAMADREHVEMQRFGLDGQKLELQKVSELANIEKERIRIADSMELHRQTMMASKALSQLDGTEPDYQKKVLGIMADNPMASKDPMIAKAITFRNNQAMERQRAQSALDNFKAEEDMRTTDDLLKEQNAEGNREKLEGLKNTDDTKRQQNAETNTARENYGNYLTNEAKAKAKLAEAGDDAGKKAAAQAALEGFTAARTNFEKQFPVVLTPGVAAVPPASGGSPKAGDIDGGFRFKGGDPADQTNWEKAP
jgi:hypothetical protein